VHVHDAAAAAEAVRSFVAGRSLDDYRGDLMLRSAVERQFEILGEALGRALKAEPELQRRLPALRGAIDFRNVIAHEYDRLADATVWDIACNELAPLLDELNAELTRRPWPPFDNVDSPRGRSTVKVQEARAT
jgi:uncharacterized protein with HEPN domain